MIVDGGLGLELERRGFAYTTGLWSAEAVLSRPDLLIAIHRDFLAAGACVLETATYQISYATLRELGFADAEIEALFVRAVACARTAIAAHVADAGLLDACAFTVAGSMGPYGATRADGSEYTGRQHLERSALYAFHHERTQSLARAAPDVLLFETIPTRTEALVVAEVARHLGCERVWLSLACADGERTYGGDRLADIVADLEPFDCIEVLGINCTAPAAIGPLVHAIQSRSAKPILVCPNLGQHWESVVAGLAGGASDAEFLARIPEWLALGVAYIGGCCGVTPQTIAAASRLAQAARSAAQR
jgi:homocysteine S-methyltransferase